MVFHRFCLYIVHYTLYIDHAVRRVGVCFEIECVVILYTHGNRQVQGHYGVAAVGGGERLGVVAGLAVEVPVPAIAAVRGLDGELGTDGMVDGQVQRYDAVAAARVGERLGVVAGLEVNRIVPGVAVAGGGFDKLSYRLVDRQRHRDDTVAAASSL